MTYIINGVMIMAILCVVTSPDQVGPSAKQQASSTEILERQANLIKFFCDSVKRQAVILKRQAASCKLLDH